MFPTLSQPAHPQKIARRAAQGRRGRRPRALLTGALLGLVTWSAAAADLPLAKMFPVPGATAVCPDTPLRVTFPAPVERGTTGKIHIIDAASGVEVAFLDAAVATATQTIGGLANFAYYPILISGNEAELHLAHGALDYGKKYTVKIEPGVFGATGAQIAGTSGGPDWAFTTKASPPKPDAARLTVAADGSGDFCTVQGALDSIPVGNTRPTTIFIRNGTYQEIVFFANKHALTLRGEDRAKTVIAYANNERFNINAGGNPFGTPTPDPSAAPLVGGAIYHRGVLIGHHCDDLVLAHLTVRNTTPLGGSQAEAVILNGTTTARAILKDLDLFSYQDTLQINGQAYVHGCRIEGDVDFMWGTGPCFFENCTARTLRSGAYFTQIRNPPTNHGYVYLRCTFDGATGVTGNFLSRVAPARFPASEVVLLDCTVTEAVSPVAWQFQGAGDLAQIHFWEYNSRDAAGVPVESGQRLPGSKRLTREADAATVASYQNPTSVLGHGWNPRRAPIFTAK